MIELYSKGLKTLVCYNCPLVKNIPKIEGLKKYECHNCPMVRVIPTFEDIMIYIAVILNHLQIFNHWTVYPIIISMDVNGRM